MPTRTPASLIRQATGIGANTAILVERMMRDRPHPEQGYRSAFGVLSLARRYERERLEAACERALIINAISYSSVNAILKSGLEPRAARGRARQADTAARQHPRRLLLSVKERNQLMLTHPTLDQMQALGLAVWRAPYRELAEQSNADDLSRDEWLGLMLDRETAIRATSV